MFDAVALPIVFISALALRALRRVGIDRLPWCLQLLRRIGIFPLRDHYYEPLFNSARLKKSLRADRELIGIDWNVEEQLQLLDTFNFNTELLNFPMVKRDELEFSYDNPSFGSGDSEYLYNIVRHFKPRRVCEIGSGHSTLLILSATKMNQKEDGNHPCQHICVEPYEMPWLEKTGATIIRTVVEEVDKNIFAQLEKNDILFIDSSHIIRPQGDVLFEFLEVLPSLKPGVLIHVHDIFTPKDYLDEWIFKDVRFWNEQYLLEAFLTFNREFKIIGALNYLRHHYTDKLVSKCPILKTQIEYREPGSFWMRRV